MSLFLHLVKVDGRTCGGGCWTGLLHIVFTNWELCHFRH